VSREYFVSEYRTKIKGRNSIKYFLVENNLHIQNIFLPLNCIKAEKRLEQRNLILVLMVLNLTITGVKMEKYRTEKTISPDKIKVDQQD
jgi:hypothetical protein